MDIGRVVEWRTIEWDDLPAPERELEDAPAN